jgi:uncharacterized protein (DUF1810 family)
VTFDLDRFVQAQATVIDDVFAELRRGRKLGHWMWFVFPQLVGLGRSETSRRFGIGSLEEARAYLAHPVLGPRLRACAAALLESSARTAEAVLGPVDALKLRSSMTLFHRAAQGDTDFAAVLDRFFGGAPDPLTDALLRAEGIDPP